MKYVENAELGALGRAPQFFDENGVALTGVIDLEAARKRLDDVTATFTAHAFDQDVGSRGKTPGAATVPPRPVVRPRSVGNIMVRGRS